jgi:hypothetical protein
LTAIQGIAQECVRAGLNLDPSASPNTLAGQLFGFGVCFPNAYLYPAGNGNDDPARASEFESAAGELPLR